MIEGTKKLLLPLLETKLKIQFPEKIQKVTYVGPYLLLHYNFYDNKSFLNYEDYLVNHELFKKHLDNGNITVYSFKMPEEYMEDIKAFNENKLKNFSLDAKELILRSLKKKGFILDFQKLKYFWAETLEEKESALKEFVIPPKELDNIKVDIDKEKFNYLRDMDLQFEEKVRIKLGFE